MNILKACTLYFSFSLPGVQMWKQGRSRVEADRGNVKET